MADSGASAPKPSSSVKLVLLGEAAVGKVCPALPGRQDAIMYEQLTDNLRRQSSLVMRFVNNDFQENKEPTIGGTFEQPTRVSRKAHLSRQPFLHACPSFPKRKPRPHADSLPPPYPYGTVTFPAYTLNPSQTQIYPLPLFPEIVITQAILVQVQSD